MSLADIQAMKALKTVKNLVQDAPGKNLYDKSVCTVGYFLSETNGTIIANATYETSDYIPVVIGQSYAITRCRKIVFYDSNKSFTSGIDVPTTSQQVVISPVTGYMRVTFNNGDPNSQIEIGTAQTTYQSYKLVPTLKTNVQVPSALGVIADVSSKNLFNLSTRTVGYYIDDNNGTMIANATYDTSDYIPITSGQSYAITTCRKVIYYNSSKVFYQGVDVGPSATKVVTAPITGYMRVSFPTTSIPIAQVERGTIQTSFQPYGSVKTLSQQVKINESTNIQNILYGKVLLNFGDSIAAGDGNSGTGYAELIANANGMACIDRAIGGATVRVVNGVTNNILNQINNTSETNIDYILINGMTNDAYTTVTGDPIQLGSISTGYTATLDTSTFCGAFETTLKTLKTKWIGKKILYVLVHKMPSRDTGAQDSLQSLGRQMCQKWSVPFVDLYNEGGLNSYISEMQAAYTDAGGTHPNASGYNTFFVPRIAAKMKML